MAQRKVNCEVYTDRGIVGKDGAEGKSAYQQAVEGGYQGTEEEFEQALASDIAVVSDNVTNINVVGNNIENVNTAVDNMSAIIAAPTAATQASASASQAATSATNAQTSETNAATSASNAATSASNAATSATNASASATIATTKASEATSSATSASASANSASESATSASTSATNAQTWAEGTDAQVTTLGGEHSSKGWANIAKQYAESIGSALKYKGSVSTYSALPSTGQEIGDTWNVLDTGDNYAWTGTEWDKLSGTVDLSAYRTSADQDIIDSKKQDTITDLATIRSGASAGATAVQPGDLATVATSGMYSDLTGTPGVATADTLGLVKPDGTTITVTEDGTISATQQDLSGYAKTADLGTMASKSASDYSTTVQANSLYAAKGLENTVSTLSTTVAGKVNSADLATVAISGSYNDLSNKPAIPDTSNLATKTELDNYIPTSQKGTASGVATLGTDGKVPTSQLPEMGGGSGFDFEGTKAEFDAAVAAGTITADSVSLITDDVDGANVATKAELQAVDRSKADTSLANLSTAGKSLASGLGMPSDRYINLTLGASGSVYTAPANGYVFFSKVSNAAGEWIQFAIPLVYYNQIVSSGIHPMNFVHPVFKNTSFKINYNATGSTEQFRFIYAEGNK